MGFCVRDGFTAGGVYGGEWVWVFGFVLYLRFGFSSISLVSVILFLFSLFLLLLLCLSPFCTFNPFSLFLSMFVFWSSRSVHNVIVPAQDVLRDSTNAP